MLDGEREEIGRTLGGATVRGPDIVGTRWQCGVLCEMRAEKEVLDIKLIRSIKSSLASDMTS